MLLVVKRRQSLQSSVPGLQPRNEGIEMDRAGFNAPQLINYKNFKPAWKIQYGSHKYSLSRVKKLYKKTLDSAT
jgi:hypothetical protein